MLAKNVNDNAYILDVRGACEFFASKLGPTSGLFCGRLFYYFRCCFSSSDACSSAERTAGTWLTTLSKP